MISHSKMKTELEEKLFQDAVCQTAGYIKEQENLIKLRSDFVMQCFKHQQLFAHMTTVVMKYEEMEKDFGVESTKSTLASSCAQIGESMVEILKKIKAIEKELKAKKEPPKNV